MAPSAANQSVSTIRSATRVPPGCTRQANTSLVQLQLVVAV
jgi:hypothetical protein